MLTHPVDASCLAIIDGNPKIKLPLWVIDPKDVELFEAYGGRATYRQITARSRAETTIGGCPALYVWMRK